jgi:hypothetical protein
MIMSVERRVLAAGGCYLRHEQVWLSLRPHVGQRSRGFFQRSIFFFVPAITIVSPATIVTAVRLRS